MTRKPTVARTPVTAAEIESFIAAIQAMNDESYKGSSASAPKIYRDKGGRKYIRIVRESGSGARSVHCFVEAATGNILKAASWKAPAKHARGNIRQADLTTAVSRFEADDMTRFLAA